MLTVLALSTLTHARIGETVAQCDARYGELMDFPDDNGDRHYNKNGFIVFASFNKDGRCGKIHYLKKNNKELTTPELKAIMRANGKGWVEDRGTEGLKVWRTDSRVAYLLEGRSLFVYTLAYEDAEAKRKEAEKLNAF